MDAKLRAVWAQAPTGALVDVTAGGEPHPTWVSLVANDLTPDAVWIAGRRTWDSLRKHPVMDDILRHHPGILLTRTRLKVPASTTLLHETRNLSKILDGRTGMILGGLSLLGRYGGHYQSVQRLIVTDLPSTEFLAPQLNGLYRLTRSAALPDFTWEEWKAPKSSTISGYDLEVPNVRFINPERKQKRK